MSDDGVIRSGSAGALLRAARERQNMHIAVLATAIKVSPRKLEALESDRYDELVDMTFTRALAQTVCRALKIDAAPVLALLPVTGPAADMASHLELVGAGLNAPFRDKPGRRDPSDRWTLLNRPAFWGALFVLAAAVALSQAPADWLDWRGFFTGRPDAPAPAPAASAIVVVPAASEPAAPEIAAAPVESAASAVPEATPASGALQLRSSAQTWVQVQDASGTMLVSRNLQPGEVLGLDGAPPLRVTIGNASATQLSYRGKPVDMATHTRDNVARIELN